MRSIVAGVGLGILLFAVGCNHAPHRRDPNGRIPTDDALPTTTAALVGYLNRNAALIGKDDALRCRNLAIDCKANGQSVGLGGMMMCQKPRNFRLQAKVLGNPTVDIGSNNDEFWYWIGKNNPPNLYHCSYQALANGARVPFPFQPDMVLTALGLAEYDPAKAYKMKVIDLDNRKGSKAIELIEQTISPQNQRIEKVTVFDFHEAKPPQPQVIAHVLRDERGTPICVVDIRTVQKVGPKGAIIPKEVVFKWPGERLQMTMHINSPDITGIDATRISRVFSRQGLNYEAVDLATNRLDGPGLQRAGASSIVPQR